MNDNALYILRLYDMMDGWIDVTGPLPKAEADARWARETCNGTKNTKYSDGDYWKVFPANTRMLVTPEFLGRE